MLSHQSDCWKVNYIITDEQLANMCVTWLITISADNTYNYQPRFPIKSVPSHKAYTKMGLGTRVARYMACEATHTVLPYWT